MRSPGLSLFITLLCAAGLPATAAAQEPRFDEQWALQAEGGLDAPAAWTIADGTGTIVAVLDTGAELGHPDLRGALWSNPGETPGNGIDDDANGWVDDVNGVDLVNRDGDPADDEGHGTHVAGMIAAPRDGRSIVGLAPGARLMVVKVLDARRGGNTAVLSEGIAYAVAHGASVINTSINGDHSTPDLEQAVALAERAGIPIVASAGNQARSLDVAPSYPASYDGPGTIAVASAGPLGLLSAFSNFGRGSVELAAPGEDILSSARGGGLELRSGTSMAAPLVAATVALLRDARPELTPAQLRDALVSGAARPRGLAGLLGGGGLDPVASLRAVGATPAASGVTPMKLTVKVRRSARSAGRTRLTWSMSGATTKIASFRVTGRGGRRLARVGAARRGAWVRVRSGRVRVTALDAAGRPLAAKSKKI